MGILGIQARAHMPQVQATTIEVNQGDTRSVDYSSCGDWKLRWNTLAFSNQNG